MKKDIEWLRKEFDSLFNGKSILTVGKSVVDEILDQLDEPETLSQEWVDRHTDKFVGNDGFRFVNTKDLKNLLVPKQEEIDRAYEEGRELGFYKGYREGLADKGGEPETVADVITTFWKSFERLKEVMSMEVEEWEE